MPDTARKVWFVGEELFEKAEIRVGVIRLHVLLLSKRQLCNQITREELEMWHNIEAVAFFVSFVDLIQELITR